MFYCWIHNWYSITSPCPACMEQTTTTTGTSLPNENKRNDSFQWTDELALEFCYWDRTSTESSPKKAIEKFKQSHPPKPQAENKPDWDWQLKDRVEFESADGYAEGYIEHIFWYKETAGIVFQDPHDLTKTLRDEVSFHKLKKLSPQPQKEEQRIEVTGVGYFNYQQDSFPDNGFGLHNHIFSTRPSFPKEKYPLIKQAIEQVLNS